MPALVNNIMYGLPSQGNPLPEHARRQQELAKRQQAANMLKAWWGGLHPLDKTALVTGPIPVLGDITGAAADIRMFAEEPESRTWGNAGLAALGLLPFVPGAVGIIAGKGAKTADLAKMRLAKQMAGKGDDIADIHKKTGWWQGPDGQWRFEIDDSGAKLNKQVESGGVNRWPMSQQTPTAELLPHDELYRAYPDAGEIPTGGQRVSEMDKLTESYNPGGSYSEKGIDIRGRTPEEMKGTTLHELQHAIQGREGFARGGSPDMFRKEIGLGIEAADYQISDLNKRMRSNVRYSDRLKSELIGNPSPEKQKIISDLAERYRELMDQRATLVPAAQVDLREGMFKKYQSLAGEAEARLVQTRMNLTPAQRAARPPWLDFDVPIDEQIVRYGDDVAQSTSGYGVDSDLLKQLEKAAPDADAYISQNKHGITLSQIEIPKGKRNQGVGSAFMDELVKYADDNGLPIALTASGDYGGSKAGQQRFYKRFGFKLNKGRNKDFMFRENMIRQPQGSK